MTQELKNINVQIEELESKINRAGEIKENRDYWEERVASLEQKLDNLSPEESKQNEKNKEKYEKAKIIWEEYCKKYDEAKVQHAELIHTCAKEKIEAKKSDFFNKTNKFESIEKKNQEKIKKSDEYRAKLKRLQIDARVKMRECSPIEIKLENARQEFEDKKREYEELSTDNIRLSQLNEQKNKLAKDINDLKLELTSSIQKNKEVEGGKDANIVSKNGIKGKLSAKKIIIIAIIIIIILLIILF